MTTVATDTPLHVALVTMLHEDRAPMCGYDPELWLSDSRRDRAAAAVFCVGCPIIAECAAEADMGDEKFGVWGGRDRTVPSRSHSA